MNKLWLLILAFACVACEPVGDNELTLVVISDLTPGTEAATVSIKRLNGQATPEQAPAGTLARSLSWGDALARGLTIGTFHSVPSGIQTFDVVVSRQDGTRIARRPVVAHIAKSTTLRIAVTASCANVDCSSSSVSPIAACVAGECVDPRCSEETPQYCGGVALCFSNGDCDPASVSCASVSCVGGLCIEAPKTDACASEDEYCVRELGCTIDTTPPLADAGVADAAHDMELQLDGTIVLPTDAASDSTVVAPMDGAFTDAARDAAVDAAPDARTVDAAADAIAASPDAESDAGLEDCLAEVMVTDNASVAPYVNCRSITALWAISSTATVIELPNLRSITNSVTVTNNASLETLRLPKVTYIGGAMTINGNASLSWLDMTSLEDAGALNPIMLSDDDALDEIAFPNLRTASHVMIYDHANVIRVDLHSLGTLYGSISMQRNARLRTVDASQLATMDGDPLIDHNDSLTYFDLRSLRDVAGTMYVSDNARLCEFVDMSQLTTGSVMFTRGSSCNFCTDATVTMNSDLAALATCTSLNSLDVSGSVTEVSLPALQRISGLNIANAPMLTNISLPGLTHVDGTLSIFSNVAAVTNLDLRDLQRVEGNLLLQSMDIDTLDLGQLTFVGVSLNIGIMNEMETLGLDRLRVIGNSMDISSNPVLRDLSMAALQTSGPNGMTIASNGIRTLSMPVLTRLGAYLSISGNDQLTSVNLRSFSEVTGSSLSSVSVAGNARLCEFIPREQVMCIDFSFTPGGMCE